VLLNASAAPISFTLPPTKHGDDWMLLFDTARPEVEVGAEAHIASGSFCIEARSTALLRCKNGTLPL